MHNAINQPFPFGLPFVLSIDEDEIPSRVQPEFNESAGRLAPVDLCLDVD